MNLQEMLQGLSVEEAKELLKKDSITLREHPSLPLASLKYNQIESDFTKPHVQEARGIVFNTKTWEVVGRPFGKFFNLGEPNAHSIDWDSAKVYEKLDGSLMILYYHDRCWQVASSGTPNAGGNVDSNSFTFCDLFWRVFEEMKLNPPEDTTKTYMFELCTPYNRIVVPHADNKIYLIGVKDTQTGQELDIELFPQYNPVRKFDLFGADACREFLKTRSGLDQEGFVVCDKNFNRVKMKSEDYVRLHIIRGEGTPSFRRFIDIYLARENEEFLTYYPQYKSMYDDCVNRIEKASLVLEKAFETVRDAVASEPEGTRKKAFAALAIKYPFSGYLFARNTGKTSGFRAWILEMTAKDVEELVGRVEKHETV